MKVTDKLKAKLKQALRYKSSSFRLINSDKSTELSRDDLYTLIELIPMTDKEIEEQVEVYKMGLINTRNRLNKKYDDSKKVD